MKRSEAWSRFSRNDVVAVWKRVGNLLNTGHAKVLPMIKPGICRLPTFCGWGVGAAKRRNAHQVSYRYHEITYPSKVGMPGQLLCNQQLQLNVTPCCHVFQRESLVRGCKADALTHYKRVPLLE